jgi:glycosyltransferase involved in cell wall biosynthesis
MRILIVTHSPLSQELGAGQVALNLASSLRKLGNEVILWSASGVSGQPKWWQALQVKRRALDSFLNGQERFDIVDVPAALLTPKLSAWGLTVVRSVQPELHYLVENLLSKSGKWWSFKSIIRRAGLAVYSGYFFAVVMSGWFTSKHILCLGTIEFQWMRRWFPWWCHKTSYYVNCPASDERGSFHAIRLKRKASDAVAGRKFLWLGRWQPHKGTAGLVRFINERIASVPEDVFTIAGCGPLAESDFTREQLSSGQIKIIPTFDRRQLYEILSSHDVGLFTSRVEGWGLGICEMLESGMTVFATDVGGVPDLKRYFPRTLRKFPPPLTFAIELEAEEILEEYFSAFNWDSIAVDYIRQVLGVH